MKHITPQVVKNFSLFYKLITPFKSQTYTNFAGKIRVDIETDKNIINAGLAFFFTNLADYCDHIQVASSNNLTCLHFEINYVYDIYQIIKQHEISEEIPDSKVYKDNVFLKKIGQLLDQATYVQNLIKTDFEQIKYFYNPDRLNELKPETADYFNQLHGIYKQFTDDRKYYLQKDKQ
jgi:hypothetical protein